MSSEFEKALARAAAEHKARDAAKIEQEREIADRAKLAHSIIDPYLAELGPIVSRTLRDLGIATYYESSGLKGGYGLGRQTDYWRFYYFRDSDTEVYFTLDDRGVFEQRLGNNYVNALGVGLISGKRIIWQEQISGPMMFADVEDRKVYVKRRDSYDGPDFQELSEFLSAYIGNGMR